MAESKIGSQHSALPGYSVFLGLAAIVCKMKAIVEGLATEYTDEGHGQVVLMLHGWGDNLHTFDPLLQFILKYRVVRLDLPGFGNSEKPQDVWGVQEYANFVRAFCAKLDIVPEAILGHSFGGRIILKGVGTGVLSPQKIILIASAGIAKRRACVSVGIPSHVSKSSPRTTCAVL